MSLHGHQNNKVSVTREHLRKRTTSTASRSRSGGALCWRKAPHVSCSSMTLLSPSAVQSETIQPQSRVLNGKPPYGDKTSGQNELQLPVRDRVSKWYTPCWPICSIFGTPVDFLVSVCTAARSGPCSNIPRTPCCSESCTETNKSK